MSRSRGRRRGIGGDGRIRWLVGLLHLLLLLPLLRLLPLQHPRWRLDTEPRGVDSLVARRSSPTTGAVDLRPAVVPSLVAALLVLLVQVMEAAVVVPARGVERKSGTRLPAGLDVVLHFPHRDLQIGGPEPLPLPLPELL
ncbi:hypothetical protein IWX50DRAFT_644866 [Phyllosticta citricarpa]